MAFRKRNLAVNKPPDTSSSLSPSAPPATGVRPSPLTSVSVTSTGCSSLDGLFGGHGGLALGSCVLIEESGTTDFAGALLRYYAAEGICQCHVLHVVGVGDGWVRELPAVAEERSSSLRAKVVTDEDKMKIAWRYERLGQAGERALPDRSQPIQQGAEQDQIPFCHTFDLSKRLTIPQDAKIGHLNLSNGSSPFDQVLRSVQQSLHSSPPTTIHRLIIPTILSPALYPPSASQPQNLLRFLHALRALLRQHPTQLTAMITLPLSLYPRTTGLVRWAEILSDGVVELTPFPHLMDNPTDSSAGKVTEGQPQGMLRVHKLPIDTERGRGGAGAGNSIGEDLAFTVSRRKFVIKPYSLPPVEGDQDAQAQAEGGGITAKDVEF